MEADTLTKLLSRRISLSRQDLRPGIRTLVAVPAVAVVVVMAFAVGSMAGEQLRQTATESTLRSTEAIVRGYVDPALDADHLTPGAPSDPRIDLQFERLAASGDLRRINLWAPDGRIVYSSEPSLRGQRFAISDELATALLGESVAHYESAPDGESEAEPTANTRPTPAHLLEIYVPVRGNVDGHPLGVYEVYQDALPIEDRVEQTRREVFLIAFGAVSALLALLWLGFAGASQRLGRQNRLLRRQTQTQRALAADLSRSEERLRALLRNSGDVILILADDGTIDYESPAAERVLGYPMADRIGRSPWDIAHPDDRDWIENVVGSLRATPGGERTAIIRATHADGSTRSLEVLFKNLLDDPAVAGVVVNYRDITDRLALEEQLRHQAFHDPLTGLPNRALLADRLDQSLTREVRSGSRTAVLFLDLDDFKAINDTFGHAVGDRVLVEVGARLAASVRPGDTVARMGGDEFAVLMEHVTRPAVEALARRLRDILAAPYRVGTVVVQTGSSVGAALSEGPGRSAAELLRNADVAMYSAKTAATDHVSLFDARVHAPALERISLKADIQSAFDNGELRLVYQPIVDLETGARREFEALLRWRNPARGDVPPVEFVPLLEENGLIVPVGRWILREATRACRAWQQASGNESLGVSVNLSARQIQEPGLVADVAEALRQADLPAQRLTLEITESVLLLDEELTERTFAGLKALGVRLAIDDFGTGYSSLSYLRRFAIDVLKIDRVFVAGVDRDQAAADLVDSMVGMARALGMEVVAEGIERSGQMAALQRLGAGRGQGYLFARPLEGAQVLDDLRPKTTDRPGRRDTPDRPARSREGSLTPV